MHISIFSFLKHRIIWNLEVRVFDCGPSWARTSMGFLCKKRGTPLTVFEAVGGRGTDKRSPHFLQSTSTFTLTSRAV